MSSVFLCHSSKDKPFVRELAVKLRGIGVRVWLDEAELKIGDSLTEKIGMAVEEMDYFAIVLSNNSVNSVWVQKELQTALSKELSEERVVVLPILLEKVKMPPFLRDKLYADFTNEENFSDSFSKILKSLGINGDIHRKNINENSLEFKDEISEILNRYTGSKNFYFNASASAGIVSKAVKSLNLSKENNFLVLMDFSSTFLWIFRFDQFIVFTEKGVYFGSPDVNEFLPYLDFPDINFSFSKRISIGGQRGAVRNEYTYTVFNFGAKSFETSDFPKINPELLIVILNSIKDVVKSKFEK